MIQRMIKNWLKRAGLDEEDPNQRIKKRNESAIKDLSKFLEISEIEVINALGWS